MLRHIGWRLRHVVQPAVTIVDPPADIRLERDVEVPMRDGVVLRANVFRPAVDDHELRPVILSAHPYGKDAFPRPRRRGRGYRPPLQARLIPQSQPYTISAFTTWEAPDPAYWVPRGYVVVNADLRGWGRSDGVGELLSAQEGDDYHDLIEWAAAQPWSNGRVGLNGVSYLAIAQWGAAATRPPHLAAICPWEGFTDLYRDFARPGGIREDGFVRLWSTMMGRMRRSPVDLRRQQKARPYFDDWYAARIRDLEQIDVPTLVCGSFSDHNLHSRGSFEGYRRVSSTQKWLYTHRGPKWATYYTGDALDTQRRFFDHVLRQTDDGFADTPRVRIEVREDADTIAEVRHVDEWPPPGTRFERLYLTASGALVADRPSRPASVAFEARGGAAHFTYRFERVTDLVGPMALRLHVEAVDADDLLLFAGIRKRSGRRIVGFEGSYGFPRAMVTVGWSKASHRHLDPERSLPGRPWHDHLAEHAAPLRPGEKVAVEVELLPSATRFQAGDRLELVVQGRWFFSRNPLVGQFPAIYESSRRGRALVHCGGSFDSALTVPRQPGDARS